MTSSWTVPNGFEMVGIAGVASLAVLGVVGRRSYHRKVSQLTKELEKEAMGRNVKTTGPAPKVWAVLTPGETVKVFMVPMAVVFTGCGAVGYGVKRWYGVRDWDHAFATLRWVARTGPPPQSKD